MKRTRGGTYQLRLSPEERQVLRGLPGEMLAILETDDPALRRLFPPAYKDDPALEAEYRHFMADDLVASHRRALDLMAETVDAEVLDEEQVLGWLGAINDLRLVIGTRLDVSEDIHERAIDPDDPNAPMLALYEYLGHLQYDVIDALRP